MVAFILFLLLGIIAGGLTSDCDVASPIVIGKIWHDDIPQFHEHFLTREALTPEALTPELFIVAIGVN